MLRDSRSTKNKIQEKQLSTKARDEVLGGQRQQW
jgi:hypothetical protein